MLALRLSMLLVVVVWLTGPSGPFVLVGSIIGASFMLAGLNASPRPPETLLALRRRVTLWVRELVAAWSVIIVLRPLERWLMPRDSPGLRDDLPPVLMIHGYVNNAGAMFILWRAIKNAGFAVHTLNLEPVYADIDSYADGIEVRLAALSARLGGRRVVLVCHSMGGLAARAYLRKHGGARVERVITLGSPHTGTVHACTALGINGSQMRPGSAWLADLARFEQGRWPCPLVSFFSYDDNMVAPQLSARLEGARNLDLSGVGHISLPMSATVATQVIGEIDPGSRPGGV